MKYEPANFKVTLKGLSYDKRTNAWSVSCNKCKNLFYPQTTMLSSQLIECPKCGISEVINYNDL